MIVPTSPLMWPAGCQPRLGAIYALERLARDSPRDHPTVMEVLSAFIRNTAPQVPDPPESFNSDEVSPDFSFCPGLTVAPDIQAALTVVGRRNTAHDRRTDWLDLKRDMPWQRRHGRRGLNWITIRRLRSRRSRLQSGESHSSQPPQFESLCRAFQRSQPSRRNRRVLPPFLRGFHKGKRQVRNLPQDDPNRCKPPCQRLQRCKLRGRKSR